MSDTTVVPLPVPTPERITLSRRDRDAFMAALDNPPEPNVALKELFEEFGPWNPPAGG